MIGYLSYIFRYRIREKPFSYGWYKIWAKRLVNLDGLILILYRISRLSLKGAEIGTLSAVGDVEINGIAANLKMGRECVLGSGVRLALHDKIILGNNVVINDGCTLLTASHDINSHDWHHVKAPILIEDYAWIATNSIILPGITIGYAAVVGAGAVVTKSVPAYHVVAGNPARIVKERTLKKMSHSTVRFLAPIEAWVGLRDD
jgi:acetyltransferase-like isoleucine patch superfamily enzyme